MTALRMRARAFLSEPEVIEVRTRVTVDSSLHDARLVVIVDDDGPGIEAAMREAVLQRGVRADEAAPGSGLGLAIVRDLAELYGGSIALEPSPVGGLRARLELPAADLTVTGAWRSVVVPSPSWPVKL